MRGERDTLRNFLYRVRTHKRGGSTIESSTIYAVAFRGYCKNCYELPTQPNPHPSPQPTCLSTLSSMSPSHTSIPSLSLDNDELILPGSELQKALAASLEGQVDMGAEAECVICMENFTCQNPCMLTLCNCGMNKTLFHYSCLLQWTEKNKNCPACRHELLWEEREGQEEIRRQSLQQREEENNNAIGIEDYDYGDYIFESEEEEEEEEEDDDDDEDGRGDSRAG
ncbi:hypothetical protein TrLO_g7743 [Triparma laevis f. longispina]|uniref:RING-type domain-containing protein n=1 Tax=Triparma laevis f. longispina TaxID=1714387 RepID=A0A9W7AU06_9STRA|nr:hypothetical protein TrLO_g7743 [Triparma laevis f. longispina]